MTRFIGQPLRRTEDPRLLTGRGRYVDDIRLPGTLHVAFVRSPHAHARVVAVDTAAARARPGVVDVVTFADLGPAGQPIPFLAHPPEELRRQWNPLFRVCPLYPLANGRVRYVGDPVAAVVAADRYQAEDAAEAVAVTYDPLPAVVDAEAALAPDAPRLYPEWDSNVSLRLPMTYGDVAGAFRRAALTFSDTFTIQRQTGMPLETRGIIAAPQQPGCGLTIWSATQLPHFLRNSLARLLDLAEFDIRVIAPDVGGGFGVKVCVYPEEVVVARLALVHRRPIKWVEDRLEHLQTAVHSRDQVHRVEVAADACGRLLALRDRMTFNAGAYAPWPVTQVAVTLCHLLAPYKVPALAAEGLQVHTNKGPGSPVRGAGRPEAAFVMDRIMDRIAAELGLDPVEVRRRNLIPAAEMPYSVGIPYRDGSPMVLDSGDYVRSLEAAMGRMDYAGFRARQAAARREGRHLGIGVSCSVEATGIGPFEGARVTVDPSGQILLYTGASPQGQGFETIMAQVVADAVGVSPAEVRVVCGDTDTIPYGLGAYSSRITVMGGNAIHQAATRLRDKALALAAHVLEASVADLDLVDGRVTVRGVPGRGISLGRLAAAAGPLNRRPEGMEPGLEATEYFRSAQSTWSYATHAAEVEVDPGTGALRILRYVVMHDAGRLINPRLVEGQIAGGVAHGIGGACLEHMVYDAGGQLLSGSLMDYLLPSATEVPDIEVCHTETPSPLNPLGVKGAGEGGTIGPAAALAAAVEDALRPFDVRVTRTPLDPEGIRRLLREAGAGREPR